MFLCNVSWEFSQLMEKEMRRQASFIGMYHELRIIWKEFKDKVLDKGVMLLAQHLGWQFGQKRIGDQI